MAAKAPAMPGVYVGILLRGHFTKWALYIKYWLACSLCLERSISLPAGGALLH